MNTAVGTAAHIAKSAVDTAVDVALDTAASIELGTGAPTMAGKVVLVVMALLLAVFGVRFKGQQKPGAIGGPISAAKAFWLPFALYFWFIVCAVLAIDPALPSSLRTVYAVMAVSMWLRGIAELVMLYVTHNWRPPMGVGHDAFTIVLVVVVAVFCIGATDTQQWSSLARGAGALLWVVLASLVLEIVHAWSFFVVVGRRTLGTEGIWFADDEDPRFAAINLRTKIGNVVLAVPVFAYCVWWCCS